MTYETNDSSIRQSAPVEGYEFSGVFGQLRYTDQPKEITIAGRTFKPAVVIRDSDIKMGSITKEVRSLAFMVPQDHKLAKSYGKYLTPDRLSVTVYRAHYGDDWSTDYRVIWRGIARAYGYQRRVFSIIMGSNSEVRTHQNLRKVKLQIKCNHNLFDGRCKASRSLFTEEARVEHISEDGLSITYSYSPVHEEGYFSPGQLINKATGETRVIFNDAAGIVLIDRPFSEIQVGDGLEVVRGCNKTFAHCSERFDNADNYGGFRDKPNDSVLITQGALQLPSDKIELVSGRFLRVTNAGV